jgi:dTDP-4-amino-4,6-dideoxygalactose transaminase
LEPLEAEGLLRLPRIPESCVSNSHLFYVLLRDGTTRQELLAYLRSRDIHAVFHYVPLHTSPVGQTFGYREGDLPITENVSERLIRLPMFHTLTDDEQRSVTSALTAFLRGRTERPAVAVSCPALAAP